MPNALPPFLKPRLVPLCVSSTRHPASTSASFPLKSSPALTCPQSRVVVPLLVVVPGAMTVLDLDLPFATFLLLNPAPSLAALSSASPAVIRAAGSSACGDTSSSTPSAAVTTAAQALEVARDSPEGADDPTVSAILEAALTAIWRRIRASPAHVMTREEFAVFNYFQHRFQGDGLAVAARKRYWDHLRVFGGEQRRPVDICGLSKNLYPVVQRPPIQSTSIREPFL